MQLQTLLRNGSPLSALFPVASALFLSRRRGTLEVYPLRSLCTDLSALCVALFLVFAVKSATQRLYPVSPQSIAHASCHHGGVGCVSLAFAASQVLRTKLRLWSSLPRQSRTESTAMVTISKPAMAHW
jgi:hypothetical protein